MAEEYEIKLTPDAILKQQFATVRKGYDSNEVDTYLDQVIADYENFIAAISSLEQQNQQLKRQVLELKQNSSTQPTETKIAEPIAPKTDAPSTNFEIIQRLSQLERKVYQLEQKINPETKKPTEI